MITEHELLMKVLPDLTRLALWHAFDRSAKGEATLEFALDAWTMVWFFCPWHLSPDPPETPRNDRALYKRIVHDVQGMLLKVPAEPGLPALLRGVVRLPGAPFRAVRPGAPS